MKISRIVLRHVMMKLKQPFTTSFGTTLEKSFLLVEVHDEEGLVGYGESTAMENPLYNEETVKTNHHMLRDYLIPLVLGRELRHPDECSTLFSPIRRNMMAKAALEGAIWDLYAKRQQQPLSRALGGAKEKIPVGVSIGIQSDIPAMLRQVERFLTEGYRRIKVKVKPGADVEVLAAIRREFGDIPLMADANSAYTLDDLELLRQFDEFGLMMIEQPLAHDDIVDHAILQRELRTPICLDESIHSVDDVRRALQLGSCRIINIKVGRVGGLTPAKQIHDYCLSQDIPVWCGGMLESGVGRAHNVAIASLAGFSLPGDTSASDRYWEQDLIRPAVTVENGYVTIPDAPGIGYEVDRDQVERITVASETYR